MAKSSLNPPIVVLGMHRSGTSLVANILDSIGVSMGNKFLPADYANPNGYYEDEDFLWINKGILEHAGGSWYAPPSLSDIEKAGEKFQLAIKNTMSKKSKAAGKRSWGWKDPRTCLTCWAYDGEISNAKFIVVVRKFSDIEQSLQRIYKDITNWTDLIEDYYASAEKFLDSRDSMSINVSFEELVVEKHAEQAVRRIVDFSDRPESMIGRALKVINSR